MKIVVLDGHTLNPGDLSWEALQSLGEVTIYDRTPVEQTMERAKDVPIILTNKTLLARETIEQLPGLKYIGVLATGYNVVDIEAACQHGIVVTNVPTYGTRSVAQMVFAHLLNLTQHVAEHAQSVREGHWTACDDFCYWNFPLAELEGMTIGIIGFGQIGRATAQLALAFGMKVLAYDPHAMQPTEGISLCDSFEAVFRESDVVTLHCPLTGETEKLVDAKRLAMMKPSAFLINTGRGPLVDEQALADALNRGGIAGAGLDVLSKEPPPAENPLLTAKNCYITPHIAWGTRAARARLLATVVDNVKAFLDGNARNVVTQ